ncbi:MAG TPA: hypothetical protein VES69_06955, partial [Pyrinomonadaceae bacterium]|nr:hypothetical protein [Pyrinomonadaceae bacterium]
GSLAIIVSDMFRIEVYLILLESCELLESSSPANSQVRKGGLPPLERQRARLSTSAFNLKRHLSGLRAFN